MYVCICMYIDNTEDGRAPTASWSTAPPSLEHTAHHQTAVLAGLVDAMSSLALLLSCFKHMVKAGTGFVSLSFSKDLLYEKKK